MRNSKMLSANQKRLMVAVLTISAFFFFCLEFKTKAYLPGVPVATLAVALVLVKKAALLDELASAPKALCVLSFASACGACHAGSLSLLGTLTTSSSIVDLFVRYGVSVEAQRILCIVIAICSVPFAFAWSLVLLSLIWRKLRAAWSGASFGSTQKLIVAGVFIVLAGIATYAYAGSDAYYGSDIEYNVVYSCDSASLFKGNAFLLTSHSQNDIRQPLFAYFAFPVFGAPYLVSLLLHDHDLVKALLFNYVQVAMLLSALVFLAQAAKLDGWKATAFVVAGSCTFMVLMYVLAFEQYVVAFFWLAAAIHSIMHDEPDEQVAFMVAATGTLLVGAVLALFVGNERSVIRRAIAAGRVALSFVGTMVALCRLDVFFTIFKQTDKMIGFTSTKLTIADKAYQYFCFIADCFVAPPSGVKDVYGYPSWWQSDTTALCIIGILVMIASCVCIVFVRREKLARMAAAWIALSVFLLIVLGFGTAEGSLILYGLYFGWAFALPGVILLRDRVLPRAVRMSLNLAFCLVVIAVLAINAESIAQLITFANSYYPL